VTRGACCFMYGLVPGRVYWGLSPRFRKKSTTPAGAVRARPQIQIGPPKNMERSRIQLALGPVQFTGFAPRAPLDPTITRGSGPAGSWRPPFLVLAGPRARPRFVPAPTTGPMLPGERAGRRLRGP
jgi:hypothetical protein